MAKETREFVVFNGRLQRVRSYSTDKHSARNYEEWSTLRKYTSLRYYGDKIRALFHNEKRDTIICEDDDEEYYRQSKHDIVRCEELTSCIYETSTKRVSTASTHSSYSTQEHESLCTYEPSKEQRWCANCSKCFQRRLSHYEQYCGLDCKTAYRLR